MEAHSGQRPREVPGIQEVGAIPSRLPLHQIIDGRGTWLRELEQQLHAGVPWVEAFERYWERIAGRSPPTWPPQSGAVNWHWLTDLGELGRVVDLGSPFGELSFLFEQEGAEVEYRGARSSHLDVVRARVQQASSRISFPSGTERDPEGERLADLAVLLASDGWASRVPSGFAEHAPRIDEALGLLKSGGWFAALLPNLLSLEMVRRGALDPAHIDVLEFARIQRLHSAIQGAALRELRSYLLLPDIGCPDVIVPRTTPALVAHRSGGRQQAGFLPRIAGGLQRLRFPGMLILGQR